ncbi:MAG: helix-turn-helix domain-containing protein [bacterium]|nr:helix-turn-helix domain-containing protein [bacterium]
MTKYKKKTLVCPIENTLTVIGKKWALLIIRDLLNGKKRFGELTRSLAEISPRTLSARLSELEKCGIIKRKAFQEIPLRVEYCLTKKGHELKLILEQMRKWGQKLNR